MTGYFSTVIHQIVLTDIVSFAFVFSIILVGFGGTMAIISFDLNDLSGDFHSVKASMYTLFFFMLGFGTTDLNSHKNLRHGSFCYYSICLSDNYTVYEHVDCSNE